MWCHVKSTTCTNASPTAIESTGITALTGQCCQPQAPLAVTSVLAQTRPRPLASSSRLPAPSPLPLLPVPTPTPSSQSLAKRPASGTLRKAVRQVASALSLTGTTHATSGTTSTRRHTRRIMESSSDPDSDDALPKRTYQELLEAFRQRHCISTNLADGTKLDNGSQN